jgi:NADH-quinone oxidoreductase subunit N
VRHAYTEDTLTEGAAPDTSVFSVVGAGLLAALVLILGLIPAPLFDFAVAAGQGLMH